MISVKTIRSILLSENLLCLPFPPLHLSPYTLVSLVLLGTNWPWNGKGQSHTCVLDLFPCHLLKATSWQVPSCPPCAGSPTFLSLPHGFISIQICCYFSHLKSKTPTRPHICFQRPPHFSDCHQSGLWKELSLFPFPATLPWMYSIQDLALTLCGNRSWQCPVTSTGSQWSLLSLTLPGLSAAWDIVGDQSLLQDSVFPYFPGPQCPQFSSCLWLPPHPIGWCPLLTAVLRGLALDPCLSSDCMHSFSDFIYPHGFRYHLDANWTYIASELFLQFRLFFSAAYFSASVCLTGLLNLTYRTASSGSSLPSNLLRVHFTTSLIPALHTRFREAISTFFLSRTGEL